MDHHFIPKFYLKRWAVGRASKLCEFSTPFGSKIKPRFTSPRGAAFEIDLYALRGFPDDLRHQVETRFFQPIDDYAADILAMLEDRERTWQWTQESRSAWTRFLLGLILRHPDEIDNLRKRWDIMFSAPNDYYEAKYAKSRDADDPPTFADWLAVVPEVERERFLFEAYMETLDSEKIGTMINHMVWNVAFTNNARFEFLTSDRPIIKTFLNDERAHIVLPIGPRALFVVAKNEKVVSDIQRYPSDNLVKEVNMRVVAQAKKYVYGTDDTQRSFVQKYFGTNTVQPHIPLHPISA